MQPLVPGLAGPEEGAVVPGLVLVLLPTFVAVLFLVMLHGGIESAGKNVPLGTVGRTATSLVSAPQAARWPHLRTRQMRKRVLTVEDRHGDLPARWRQRRTSNCIDVSQPRSSQNPLSPELIHNPWPPHNLQFPVVGGGGACGGLFFWSSRHSPQGNGLSCLGHLVALIDFTSVVSVTGQPIGRAH